MNIDKDTAQQLLGRLALDPSVKATIIFEPMLSFTITELKALLALVERQYIAYDNTEGHAVINKIMKAIDHYELVGRTSKPT